MPAVASMSPASRVGISVIRGNIAGWFSITFQCHQSSLTGGLCCDPAGMASLSTIEFPRRAVRRSRAWFKCGRSMPSYSTVLTKIPGFKRGIPSCCVNCDALGIAFDFPKNAPSSTVIKCRHCGSPRGTLGSLRQLSGSDRQDLFEF